MMSFFLFRLYLRWPFGVCFTLAAMVIIYCLVSAALWSHMHSILLTSLRVLSEDPLAEWPGFFARNPDLEDRNSRNRLLQKGFSLVGHYQHSPRQRCTFKRPRGVGKAEPHR